MTSDSNSPSEGVTVYRIVPGITADQPTRFLVIPIPDPSGETRLVIRALKEGMNP